MRDSIAALVVLLSVLNTLQLHGVETPEVDQIVARSVSNNNANWKVAPQFSFKERDVITKSGEHTSRTYEVLMIDGSPYNELIAVNGKPLSSAQLKEEDRKMQREVARRRGESSAARLKRVAAYQRERRQDHELMIEMTRAFTFKLAGKETVGSRECFRIEASPRPGYVPKNRETKVLTGMRGTLWVDTSAYEWVKVTASVFRPVAFGLFIARVQPGTEFTLEETPVEKNIWMPSHFVTRVNAKVLFWSHDSIDDETYWNYRRTAQPAK